MFPNANRLVTFFVGLALLGLGICGLIHPLVQSPPPEQTAAQHMAVSMNYGYLFGILPMNIVSDLLFIALGAAGIAAAYSASTSRWYERTIFSLSVLFALMGFMPWGFNDVWGVMPLFGWLDAFFLVLALFTFYFAFVEGPPVRVLGEPVRTDERSERQPGPENPPHAPSRFSHP
jgi:hypothetical protein